MPGPIDASNDRLKDAEAFLQEAVYRSRGAQAGKALFAPQAKGQCGLGQEAAIVLDLTPRAEELAQSLWPSGPGPEDLEHIRGQMARWVELQDQLDRKRNHFLKAFRGQHGFRRADYSPETLAQYEAGLAAIHAEVDAVRQTHAMALLAGVLGDLRNG